MQISNSRFESWSERCDRPVSANRNSSLAPLKPRNRSLLRLGLSPHRVSQLHKVPHGEVEAKAGIFIGLAAPSELCGPGHEGRPEARSLCSSEIKDVRRNHHDLLRGKQIGRAHV